MADIGVLELCGFAAAISAGVAGPIAAIKWCASFVTEKVSDAEKGLKVLIDAQGHKLNNHSSRLDGIERLRSNDVERIVKLETNLNNLEKGQERIEHALEKMEAESAKGRAEIIESIRELRTVSPKP
mgnify:CR=1 FL=1